MTDTIPTPGTENLSLDQLRERQQELRDAKEIMAGNVPLIPDAPPTTIELPRGINGQRRVEVRELTGMDEEALAKNDVTDVFDAVITQATVRIGDLDLAAMGTGERRAFLRQLLVGERDQVFIAIMRATYGDERRLSMRCPHCGENQELVIDLPNDFKPKEVEDVDRSSYTHYTAKGDEIEYRLANGSDTAEMGKRRNATAAELNTLLLSRIILNVNGKLVVDPPLFARSMSMRERSKLIALLAEKQPTIDLTLTVNCVECGREDTVALTWADLFRS